MTFETLKKAKKLEDEIVAHQKELERFQKFVSGIHSPTDFVSDYFNPSTSRNDSIFRLLAINFIEDAKKYLDTKHKMLVEEFEAM